MTPQQSKIGIIAGAGELPLQIARACAAHSRQYHVIAVDEFARSIPSSMSHTRIAISKLGACIRELRGKGCVEVVFAGKFARPRDQKIKLRPDWQAILFLATNFGVLRRTDDGIHRAISSTLFSFGFRVVSPLDAAPELAAQLGCLTRRQPSADQHAMFQKALVAAKGHGISRHGQAIVHANGEVIAKEGKAGTDAMLQSLPTIIPPNSMLVKAMAPNQLPTMDPPAIGEDTMQIAAKAGLVGILVEAGRSIIVDPERVGVLADELGLFVYADSVRV